MCYCVSDCIVCLSMGLCLIEWLHVVNLTVCVSVSLVSSIFSSIPWFPPFLLFGHYPLCPSIASLPFLLFPYSLIDHCVYLYTLSVSVCVCIYMHVHLHVIRCNNSIYTLAFLFFSLSPSLPPFLSLSLSLSPSYNVLNAFPTNTILCTCTCSYLIMHYSFIHSLTLLSHSLTHLSYSLIDPH